MSSAISTIGHNPILAAVLEQTQDRILDTLTTSWSSMMNLKGTEIRSCQISKHHTAEYQ